MQPYGPVFARIYNLRWADFARGVAPLIREYYEAQPIARDHKTLLDVACGTGQVALHFLENGYRVTGIDLSEHMLAFAKQNAAAYVEQGQATFIQGNAADFRVEGTFGLAVSTFDALNHLPDGTALQGCFRSVRAALVDGGQFIFDLNTRKGLYQNWNNIMVLEDEEATVINRGVYDGQSERAHTRITAFARLDDGRYERMAETFYNTVFRMADVRGWLLDAGFSRVHVAAVRALGAAVDEPEDLPRAWFVASK